MNQNIFDEVLKSGKATHYRIMKRKLENKELPEYFIQEYLGKPEEDFNLSNFLELVHDKLKFNTNNYDDVIYLDMRFPVKEKSFKLINVCILSYIMIDTKTLLDDKKTALSKQAVLNFISRYKFLSFTAKKDKIDEMKKLKLQIAKLEKKLDDFKEDIDDFLEDYEGYSIFNSYLEKVVENIDIVPFEQDISKLIPTPLDTSKTLYLFDTKKNKVSVVSAVFNGVKSTTYDNKYLEYNLFADNKLFHRLIFMNDRYKVKYISLITNKDLILFFDKETLKTFIKGVHRKSELKFEKNMSLVDKMP